MKSPATPEKPSPDGPRRLRPRVRDVDRVDGHLADPGGRPTFPEDGGRADVDGEDGGVGGHGDDPRWNGPVTPRPAAARPC